MEREGSARLATDSDLPPGNCAIAQDTNALVVERMPFPTHVGRLEEREFFFWEKDYIHFESFQTKTNRFAF
jgi:hypothetical protein